MALTPQHMTQAFLPRQIAIIGAGVVGAALAIQLTHACYTVSISNSRGPNTLNKIEKKTGAKLMEIEPALFEPDIVILAVTGMMESVWISKTLSFPTVKASNNIIALNIAPCAKPRGSPKRVALPIAGDDDKSVTVVMELLEAIGFDAYKAGQLEDSWRQQPVQPVYCTEPTVKELMTLLSSADREKARQNRDRVMEFAQKLRPEFSPQIMVRVARLGAGP
ncbi:hypothetical protein ACQKWADRAFT_324825 [Trichoderma austrokoningii]